MNSETPEFLRRIQQAAAKEGADTPVGPNEAKTPNVPEVKDSVSPISVKADAATSSAQLARDIGRQVSNQPSVRPTEVSSEPVEEIEPPGPSTNPFAPRVVNRGMQAMARKLSPPLQELANRLENEGAFDNEEAAEEEGVVVEDDRSVPTLNLKQRARSLLNRAKTLGLSVGGAALSRFSRDEQPWADDTHAGDSQPDDRVETAEVPRNNPWSRPRPERQAPPVIPAVSVDEIIRTIEQNIDALPPNQVLLEVARLLRVVTDAIDRKLAGIDFSLTQVQTLYFSGKGNITEDLRQFAQLNALMNKIVKSDINRTAISNQFDGATRKRMLNIVKKRPPRYGLSPAEKTTPILRVDDTIPKLAIVSSRPSRQAAAESVVSPARVDESSDVLSQTSPDDQQTPPVDQPNDQRFGPQLPVYREDLTPDDLIEEADDEPDPIADVEAEFAPQQAATQGARLLRRRAIQLAQEGEASGADGHPEEHDDEGDWDFDQEHGHGHESDHSTEPRGWLRRSLSAVQWETLAPMLAVAGGRMILRRTAAGALVPVLGSLGFLVGNTLAATTMDALLMAKLGKGEFYKRNAQNTLAALTTLRGGRLRGSESRAELNRNKLDGNYLGGLSGLPKYILKKLAVLVQAERSAVVQVAFGVTRKRARVARALTEINAGSRSRELVSADNVLHWLTDENVTRRQVKNLAKSLGALKAMGDYGDSDVYGERGARLPLHKVNPRVNGEVIRQLHETIQAKVAELNRTADPDLKEKLKAWNEFAGPRSTYQGGRAAAISGLALANFAMLGMSAVVGEMMASGESIGGAVSSLGEQYRDDIKRFFSQLSGETPVSLELPFNGGASEPANGGQINQETATPEPTVRPPSEGVVSGQNVNSELRYAGQGQTSADSTATPTPTELPPTPTPTQEATIPVEATVLPEATSSSSEPGFFQRLFARLTPTPEATQVAPTTTPTPTGTSGGGESSLGSRLGQSTAEPTPTIISSGGKGGGK